MKTCAMCKVPKELDAFPRSKAEKDGRFAYCRLCNSARRKYGAPPKTEEQKEKARAAGRAWHKANREKVAARKRNAVNKHRERINRYQRVHQANKRAKKLRAMPAWADEEHIKRFYSEAEIMTVLTGIKHEVDHIVPLNGIGVCGLHVPANLRVVTREFNLKKGNKLTLV